ncbi:hypothetical protein BLNAU_21990 [Blattamonas nauphoetae]|uniref:Uncharacterized protein n=1 Tax=Blattamonas nauphoetae TaxID=2049346 RepID=A0ABQ9WUC0_9EUKA|nr:hypothetical protein BLNAU_21990 [Blattamonas nauphoetae]
MTQVNSPPQTSGPDNFDHLTVTAAEINPVERFNELLSSYSNIDEGDRQAYQQSLVFLLQRYLNHLSNDERTDLLHRFGAALSQRENQDLDFDSLRPIVSSDEDIITLFHSSGLSHSIFEQIQLNPAKYHQLAILARLSRICPLVSIGTLSEDLSSFIQSFFHDPLPYHRNRFLNDPTPLLTFFDILCNELMACAIIGCGEAVFETIITSFPSFSEDISRRDNYRRCANTRLRFCEKIIEITQNHTDSVERIAAIITHLSNRTPLQENGDTISQMDLRTQCLQHTAIFLNYHPNLIDSFLERITSSPSLSTMFTHDRRHLSLISALSQSSSPLFPTLFEPLLDAQFPLHTPLTPRSFTDPTSSFFRLASTTPAFFRSIVKNGTAHILTIGVPTAVGSVRVVSDDPSEPRCLDFGRVTPNWILLLNTIAEVMMDLKQRSEGLNSIPFSFFILLVLFAASTNDDLSRAAVSVFSNQFGLSTPHTEALLFATPTTFPVSDAFTSQESPGLGDSDRKKGPQQSICAEAGNQRNFDFARTIRVHFAGCLVNALHSTTALPHSFPFFSPELCGLSQQPNVWNDPNQPSALAALTTLADLEIRHTFLVPRRGELVNHQDDERRITIFVHLFPFFGTDSQTKFLSLFNTFHRSKNQKIHKSLDSVVECLVEMATVNSYNTPIALLTEMRKVVEYHSHIDPVPNDVCPDHLFALSLEQSIVKKLNTAEGEERGHLVTQLAVVSRGDPDLVKELTKAENDAQALLVLSVPTIRSTPRPRFHLDKDPATFDRLVELAGHLDNLPLVAAALAHIADTVGTFVHPSHVDVELDFTRKRQLRDLVWNTLRMMVVRRREGVEEGCVVVNDEIVSLSVVSCLRLFHLLMSIESFDPTPFVDSLISLSMTTDLTLLRSILLALQEIEKRTRNTPTPFSISTATAPFRGIHQSSATRQPLPTILSSILLSASLDDLLHPAQQNRPQPFSQLYKSFLHTDTPTSPSDLLREFDKNLIDVIAKEATEIKPFIKASRFLPLAPLYTRILKTVVPLSTDGTEIRSKQFEQSQLVDVFISLFLTLIHTGFTYPLSIPPLSNLLSILSIALVRLDTIPSLMALHHIFCKLFGSSKNEYNPQMKQIVHALCEEGMEDRSDVARDRFSFIFMHEWTGANAYLPDNHAFRNPFFQRDPLLAVIHAARGAVGHPLLQLPNTHPAPIDHRFGGILLPFGDFGGDAFPRPPDGMWEIPPLPRMGPTDLQAGIAGDDGVRHRPIGRFPRPLFDGDVLPFGPDDAPPPVRPELDDQAAPIDSDQST